jgi:hypothetical protein
MDTLTWILGLAGAGGALTAAAWLGLLPALVAAAMAVLRGLIDIVLDLAGCAAGRIALAVLAVTLLLVYGFHWEYSRGRAACHCAGHPAAQSTPDWRDTFEKD